MQFLPIAVIVFVLSGCISISDPFVRNELVKKKLPKKFWELPSDQAAQAMAKVFADNNARFVVKKKVKPHPSGFITYDGRFSGYGASNRMIKIANEVTEYSARFQYGYWNGSAVSFEKNRMSFSCDKLILGQKVRKSFTIIQHIDGMKMELEDFAITRDSVYSNPPIFYDELEIYSAQGIRMGMQKANLLEDDWKAKYAEAIVKHAKSGKSKKNEKKKVTPTRIESIARMRELLMDKTVPFAFLDTIVGGAGKTCLAELHGDIQALSKRVAPVSAYVKRYRKLAKVYEAQSFDITLDFNRKKSKSEKEYDALLSRFLADDEQHLRQSIDSTLETLRAVGKEQKIAAMIRRDEYVDHLVCEMYFRDRAAFTRLKLKQLEHASGAHAHYRLVRDLLVTKNEMALLDYLAKVDEKKFSVCSPEVAELIRKVRPKWKLKLQNGLIRYIKENDDQGRLTLSALEHLMPEDDPNYFDLVAVGECLLDKKVRQKIVSQRFVDGKKEYEELVAKWRKISARK